MAVPVIPNVTNWTVTPQNGQAGYFTLMNTWLGQSTTVIQSLYDAIEVQNAANEEINNLAIEVQENTDITVAAKDEAVGALAILSAGAIDDTNIALNKAFSNQFITNDYYDKTQIDSKININGFTDKATPTDTDNLAIQETGGLFKKLSWLNLKATLKTYFDTLYFSKTSGNFKLGMDNLLHIQDQKTNGTNGGASSTSFANITLNTILTNNVGASLTGSQITLQAGNYFIEATVPYYSGSSSSSSSKIKLYNETDVSDIIIGLSGVVDEMNTYQNILSGEFTISSPKNFTIKHRGSVSGGLIGYANSFSLPEIYSDVKIWKVG